MQSACSAAPCICHRAGQINEKSPEQYSSFTLEGLHTIAASGAIDFGEALMSAGIDKCYPITRQNIFKTSSAFDLQDIAVYTIMEKILFTCDHWLFHMIM